MIGSPYRRLFLLSIHFLEGLSGGSLSTQCEGVYEDIFYTYDFKWLFCDFLV